MNDSFNNDGEITELLHKAYRDGNSEAMDDLYEKVLNELRKLARSKLKSERQNHTLQTDALVNEACTNLINQHTDWQNREHFFGIAATVMRNILLNYARSKRSKKRGEKKHWGDNDLLFDEAIHDQKDEKEENLIMLDEALNKLSELDKRQAKIVELKYFGGLTIDEISELLKISTATVKREWESAKAWLRREIYDDK